MTQNRLSTASDVYSFGIIMLEMLTWQMPFYDLSKEQVRSLSSAAQYCSTAPSIKFCCNTRKRYSMRCDVCHIGACFWSANCEDGVWAVMRRCDNSRTSMLFRIVCTSSGWTTTMVASSSDGLC